MFLIAGVNGSGKSSFTRNITRKHPALKIIDPDAIAKGMTGSSSNLDSEALGAG
jgi:predicted ABC-type ATPase